jgi:hypothetical protein
MVARWLEWRIRPTTIRTIIVAKASIADMIDSFPAVTCVHSSAQTYQDSCHIPLIATDDYLS